MADKVLFNVDKNLAMELVRATEAAVMASGRWFGRGDKDGADAAAIKAMRYILQSIDIRGIVVLGEGAQGEVPMLYNGEEVGSGRGHEVDIAVNAVDSARTIAEGANGAISVIAAADRGCLFSADQALYLEKIITGPEAADSIDITAPVAENIKRVAKAKNKAVEDVTVVMLDRPRNEQVRDEVRSLGARLRLLRDGDVNGALMTCLIKNDPADLFLGSGGAHEAVLSACAIKCLGGNMQCRPHLKNEQDRELIEAHHLTCDTILTIEDLVRGDNVFFAATGASDGDLIKGVFYHGDYIRTSSICMRGRSGTLRYLDAVHSLKKLSELGSAINYSSGQVADLEY